MRVTVLLCAADPSAVRFTDPVGVVFQSHPFQVALRKLLLSHIDYLSLVGTD